MTKITLGDLVYTKELYEHKSIDMYPFMTDNELANYQMRIELGYVEDINLYDHERALLTLRYKLANKGVQLPKYTNNGETVYKNVITGFNMVRKVPHLKKANGALMILPQVRAKLDEIYKYMYINKVDKVDYKDFE